MKTITKRNFKRISWRSWLYLFYGRVVLEPEPDSTFRDAADEEFALYKLRAKFKHESLCLTVLAYTAFSGAASSSTTSSSINSI